MANLRRELEPLDDAECARLLTSAHLGRIALVQQGEPLIVPVNYLFHGGSVIFQTAIGGLLDPGPDSRAVAFEIDAGDPQYHSGWSVLVRGLAQSITDPATVAELRELPLRPWVPRESNRWVRLWPREITGRRIPALSA